MFLKSDTSPVSMNVRTSSTAFPTVLCPCPPQKLSLPPSLSSCSIRDLILVPESAYHPNILVALFLGGFPYSFCLGGVVVAYIGYSLCKISCCFLMGAVVTECKFRASRNAWPNSKFNGLNTNGSTLNRDVTHIAHWAISCLHSSWTSLVDFDKPLWWILTASRGRGVVTERIRRLSVYNGHLPSRYGRHKFGSGPGKVVILPKMAKLRGLTDATVGHFPLCAAVHERRVWLVLFTQIR